MPKKLPQRKAKTPPKKPSKKPPKKPWSGRFTAATHARVEKFTASHQFDRRLAEHDIAGSVAHARMLRAAGVLTAAELKKIERGLAAVKKQIARGEFEWSDAREDVHMHIEARLTEIIGDAGKKLHTARSRNDQVATDLRLYLRAQVDCIRRALSDLQRALVTMAAKESATIMPGFTHLQCAQPVTFGHHLLAWNEMLQRDYERMRECRRRLNVSPLGAAALAGSGVNINRRVTARELGFDGVCRNSLDAVSDRDFACEFCAHAALLMVHLSRMAEELVLWSSGAFAFVDLGDAFCTGSSIMPQKKNPDTPELIRGKCARVCGNLNALLMLMKAQPLAYNRDNQEDKESLFDSVDTVLMCLQVFAAMVAQMTPLRDNMRAAASHGFSTATDFAEYLVARGVPFRDAHAIVGRAVAFAVENNLQLSEVRLAELQKLCAAIGGDVYDALSVEGSVRARDHVGGTAPRQVARAAKVALRLINARGERPR